MSESVVADFRGRFLVDSRGHDGSEPTSGRVLLSNRRLVLASDAGKTTVPLSETFDVAVREVPVKAREFFDDTVTIGFRRDGEAHTAVVEADADVIDRFVTVLYKARLAGTTVALRHPAQVGGRVTDAAAARATLRIESGGIALEGDGRRVTIELGNVVHFERRTRELEGASRQVLSVRHVVDGTVYTTQLRLASSDAMNILGRYLRREYAAHLEAVRDLDLSPADKEVLVALYSGAEGGHLARMLDLESAQVSMILSELADDGLVEVDDQTSLTARGLLVVNEHLEDVNV
ncbi:MAG: CheF family chemotaxis protein [Halobacteriaceae archaeon]